MASPAHQLHEWCTATPSACHASTQHLRFQAGARTESLLVYEARAKDRRVVMMGLS